MKQTVLTDNTAVFYVLKRGDQEISQRFTSQILAEAHKQTLPVAEQDAAVVPVNSNGQQVLLG